MSASAPAGRFTRLRARRWRADALWTILLFAILVATLVTVQDREQPTRPYDLDSGAASGLLALRLLLEEEGYDVTTTGQRQFRLDETTSLLFVHPGMRPFSAADARELQSWVEAGGTLVLIGTHNDDSELAAAFGLRAEFTTTQNLRSAQQVLPLLPEAPATITDTVALESLNFETWSSAVPVMASSSEPTLAVASIGDGIVWFLSEDYGLTNQDLKTTGQSYLLPALLRTVPAGGRIAFDSYHQVDATAGLTFTSLQDWLYRTPTGWALLFCAVVLFGALVWQGRRLGPPLAPVAENRRREAAEFVTAMANLQRRAHQRAAVAAHHHQRLKTALGARYQVVPDLPDDEFVRALAASDRAPTPDSLTAVAEVLAGLRGNPSEATLVQWVARSDAILGSVQDPSGLPAQSANPKGLLPHRTHVRVLYNFTKET